MMLPDFCPTMIDATYYIPRRTPRTFTAMTASNAAASVSATPMIGWGEAALLTRQSMRPKRA
jgi:hypothetical protein